MIRVRNLRKVYLRHEKEPGIRGFLKDLFARRYEGSRGIEGNFLAIRYTIGFFIMTLSFYMVRVESLFFLQNEFFRYSGYPLTIFSGFSRFLFVFVIPVAVVANFPTLVLVGMPLAFKLIAYAIIFTVISFLLSCRFFYYSINKYSSTSS